MNSLNQMFQDNASIGGALSSHKTTKPSNQDKSPNFVIQSYSQLLDYTKASEDINQHSISLSLYAFTFSNAKWSKFLTILKFQTQLTANLVFLDLACCNLTNLHLEQIFYNLGFPTLEVLILSGNLLTALPYLPNQQSETLPENTLGMSQHLKSKGILTACPALRALILRNNLLSSLSGFMHQLCLHKSLHDLDISCNTRVDVGQLAYALMLSKSVRKLNLSALGLKSHEMPSLLEVCLFTKLSYLNLWCNELDEEFAKNLRDCLMSSSVGSSTAEGGHNSTNASTIQLATNLKHLNVGMNQLGDVGAIYIADLLREQQTFKPPALQQQNATSPNCIIHLKTLDLSSNYISTKGAQALASSLMLNSHLQTLNLSDNQLNVQDCEIIIKSTQNHQKLQFVNLSRNLYSEQELAHLNSVAGQFASQVHFKFQPASPSDSSRPNEEMAAHEMLVNNVDKHINAKYHPQSSKRPPTPPLVSDEEINQLINHSLMETITSELQKKSTIRSPVTEIPVAQNTFDDSVETPEKDIPQPRRDAIPEPDIHIERVVSVSRKELLPADAYQTPGREKRGSRYTPSSSSKKRTPQPSESEDMSDFPPVPHLSKNEILERRQQQSDVQSESSDDEAEDKEPSELNTFLNEIFELKKIADMSSPKRSTTLSVTGSNADNRSQEASIGGPTPRHASFSQRRSQFFAEAIVQESAAQSTAEASDNEQKPVPAPMSFLGMLKKRGLISVDEKPQPAQTPEPNSALSSEYDSQQDILSTFAHASQSPSPAETIRAQENRKRFSGNWSQQLSTAQESSNSAGVSENTSPQPPESLIQLLKRTAENHPSPSPRTSVESPQHELRSPLLAYSGKRSLPNSPPLADDSPQDLSIESPPSPFQIAGDNESAITTGTPATPLTPAAATPSSTEGDLDKSTPLPVQRSGAARFKSAANAVIATARLHRMSFKAKSLASKNQTKKKIDVQITEEGQLMVSHRPKALFGKAKSMTLYSLPIEESLKAKVLAGGKVKIRHEDSSFVLTMKSKDQTELVTALSTIQRKLEKERQEAEMENEKQKTGSEKKLLLNPFSEYVRGVRPFKSQGDNRLDVEIDALYKVEGRVNGWYFVSLVKDPSQKGYVLPQDVVVEDTSQYSFGT